MKNLKGPEDILKSPQDPLRILRIKVKNQWKLKINIIFNLSNRPFPILVSVDKERTIISNDTNHFEERG